MQIFEFVLKNNECIITDEARLRVRTIIDDAIRGKDLNFGNARFIRNLFEKIITQQANRLTSETQITNQMLATIEFIDVENAVKPI